MIKLIVTDIHALSKEEISALASFFIGLIPEDTDKIVFKKSEDINIPGTLAPSPPPIPISEIPAAVNPDMTLKPGDKVLLTNQSNPALNGLHEVHNVTPSEVDSEGLPWDARIHAKNRAKTSNGKWTRLRNISPTLVRTILNELRSNGFRVPAPPVAPVPVPPAIPTPPPIPPVAPAVPTTPAVAESDDPFMDLFARITTDTAAGKLTKAHVTATVNKFGLPSLAMVVGNLALIPQIQAELDKITGRA
jgi:hypothetical protein